MAKLREMTFHHFPERIPAAVAAETRSSSGVIRLTTEPAVSIRLKRAEASSDTPKRIGLFIADTGVDQAFPSWLKNRMTEADVVYVCEPRGMGETRWTTKNPPNYVERSHYLLGRTVDSGRIWDIAATVGYLRAAYPAAAELVVAGEGAAAVLAAYAALLEPRIDRLVLVNPPLSHMEKPAPPLLNVLRVCDVPEAFGMLAPRPVTLVGGSQGLLQRAAAIYQAAGVAEKCVEAK